MAEDYEKIQKEFYNQQQLDSKINVVEEESVEAPRYGCALAGVYGTVLGLKNAVPILHSGAGCGVGNLFGTLYAGGESCGVNEGGTATPCSCLVEEHVILGGEEKLDNLINSTIELFNSNFYVVIAGCVPSLIGDDVDSVVENYQDDHPIIHVNAPGFKAHSLEGHNLFWDAIIDSDLLEEQPIEKSTVNIFGVVPYNHVFWKGDLYEIKKLFASIGVKANVIFGDGDGLQNIKDIPKAEYNIVLNPWVGVRAAEKLKEKFGTPFLTFPGIPVGAKQTSSLLYRVAEKLSLDETVVDNFITEKEEWFYRFAEYPGDALILCRPNQYFAVVADSAYAISYTKFLTNEIGYLPDIVQITDNPPIEVRQKIVDEINNSLESTIKPDIVFEADTYRIRNNLNNRPFAFLLSSSLEQPTALEEWGACHVSASFPIYGNAVLVNHYGGYYGGLTLLEDLVSTFVGPL